MKTYAIADLHGRYDLLAKAIAMIEDDAGNADAKLVVLGDFVDRGPASRQIVERLMAGPSLSNWEWIVLQGNHEKMMLDCLADPRRLVWWLRNGGVQTLQSYGYSDQDDLKPLKMPDEHLEWLDALPIFYEDVRRIFVHAGVPFDQPLGEAKPATMQWMLYRDGGQQYSDADYHVDLRHVSGKHIVHGHHQSVGHPLTLPHRTNLDSFAWYSGRLAIGVFDETQPGPVGVLWATD